MKEIKDLMSTDGEVGKRRVNQAAETSRRTLAGKRVNSLKLKNGYQVLIKQEQTSLA